MDLNLCNIEHSVTRRAGHIMVAYKHKLYMWGGYMEQPNEGTYNLMTQSAPHFHNPNEVWIYDSLLNIWHPKICSGETPFSLSGSCAGVIGNHMYLFGGFHGDIPNEGSKNHLWRLNLDTYEWKLLKPSGFQPFPCDKSATWVYKGRFYIFGGYGPCLPFRASPPVHVAFETETELGADFKGWLDQLVYYDADCDSWVWPNSKGTKPNPRAAHAAAVLKDKAYVFGGRHKEQRLNDFYCLDLNSHLWTHVPHAECSSVPLGRSWHTLNAISDDKLLLYGGFSTSNQVLNDAWIFDSVKVAWRSLPSSRYQKRLWHCGASTSKAEVTFSGGISNNLLNYTLTKEHAEDMLKIRFSPPSLFELGLEYVSNVRNVPKHSWNLLTPVIRKILQVRTDPFEVHGVKPPFLS